AEREPRTAHTPTPTPTLTAMTTPTPIPALTPAAPPAAPPAAARSPHPLGAIQILSGGNAGKELELAKPLTTLGKPGVQVAVLTRRPQGYFITHVEGANPPTVNGQAIGTAPHALKDHDVVELAGVKMEFFLKG
ncbi:MAG: FHA domain-containing protein, partial [Burkholderiales bacterium]